VPPGLVCRSQSPKLWDRHSGARTKDVAAYSIAEDMGL
jgi:hypothetical protein